MLGPSHETWRKLSKDTTIQPDARSSETIAQPPVVLVVDDEEEFREEFALLLARRGCHVRTAADGETALQLLEADRTIEVLITDLRMPSMDGLALIDQVLRGGTSRDYIGLIVVTGHGDFLNLTTATMKPEVVLLHKPVAIPTFMEQLARIAAHVRRERTVAQ